jgi:hypothetical protein
MRLVITLLASSLSVVACFSPSEPEGAVACGANGACPPGFACAADNRCYREPPVFIDASTMDARSLDASVIDGAVVDASVIDGAAADANAAADASSVDANAATDANNVDANAGLDALITECNDGIDNDCDGQTDWPNDPGCASAIDPSELGNKQCDDGIDNDGDNGIDFHQVPGCGPTDPQCSSPSDPNE